MSRTHIPQTNGRTYCGKLVADVACIDLIHDAIDDATCKSCQRGDDRRTIEQHHKEIGHTGRLDCRCQLCAEDS
jgi:hypothetical protein